MLKIKEAIIVEGRYDKNKVSQIIDTIILETSGFSIFNDSEKRNLFKKIAEERGIVIFTDSDGAGFVIRNYIKGFIDNRYIKNAYIPEIEGKEKRKRTKSKAGILGVEGVSPEIIIEALKKAGVSFCDETDVEVNPITKADLYRMGFFGVENSKEKRDKLLIYYQLPSLISTNSLVDILNAITTKEEFLKLINSDRFT